MIGKGLIIGFEVGSLYLLSRALINNLYGAFLLFARSRPVAVSLVSLLLFPGTVIHELAHLFTAEILGVHTGKLTLAPESLRSEDESVRTGSVAIAKTGPFRRAVIGLAPTIIGLTSFSFLSYMLFNPSILPIQPTSLTIFNYQLPIINVVIIYLLFAISAAMFPSPEDMKGIPALGLTLVVLLGAAYIAGFRLSLTGQALVFIDRVLSRVMQGTLLVLAVDGLVLLIVQILLVLTRKITHRRLLAD